MKRRDFLKTLGAGAGFLAGLGLFSQCKEESSGPIIYGSTRGDSDHDMDHQRGTPDRAAASEGAAYGGMIHPPDGSTPDHRTMLDTPPPFSRKGVREISMTTEEIPIAVAHNTYYQAWTFNRTVPGPVIRATVGETLKINFQNLTKHPHSLHFHGSHSIAQDGWEPISPGQSTTYEIKAGPVGVHPYHCHVPPLAVHMSKGLYGALIVDPPGGRPQAKEFVLVLSGYDLHNKGRNDLYCWNGIAGFYDRFPLKVKVGELVRLYVINMLEYEPVSSFHLHAQTFDVYRSGTKLTPDDHTDVITLGQTERAILEFRLPERGRYMFHPHQVHMAENGAMAWIVAV